MQVTVARRVLFHRKMSLSCRLMQALHAAGAGGVSAGSEDLVGRKAESKDLVTTT